MGFEAAIVIATALAAICFGFWGATIVVGKILLRLWPPLLIFAVCLGFALACRVITNIIKMV